MHDNIWILTEEKPKVSVILQIIKTYCQDFGDSIVQQSEEVKIRPLFENEVFTFQYVVEGIILNNVASIIIKTVSGNSSFVDFLLFKQLNTPDPKLMDDVPIMAVEETKTQDKESRNTSVYQRATKFVFIHRYYPNVKTYMLYNNECVVSPTKEPSPTNKFGMNLLLSIGVKIIGRDMKWYSSFSSIDEIIKYKSTMENPPNGQRTDIIKEGSTIFISCKLDKKHYEGKISHDPNIGMVSLLAYTFKTLGWTGDIVITNHNIEQKNISAKKSSNNKFMYVCALLGLKMEGLYLPNVQLPKNYWHYEESSEKMASILLHVMSEYIGLEEVYQNHAGCERGYFKTTFDNRQLPKKSEGKNLLLPDVVLRDDITKTIVLVEGKKLSTINNGLKEINEYDGIELEFIQKFFPTYRIARGVSIFGGKEKSIPKKGVIFYLNENGEVFISDDAPACIKRIIQTIKKSV